MYYRKAVAPEPLHDQRRQRFRTQEKWGGVRGQLKYISLPALVELKLAAGRLRDEADVVELARENRVRIDEVRRHLANVHRQYATRFDELVAQMDEVAGE